MAIAPPRVSDGEDLVSRARSIFARLRDDADQEVEESSPEPSPEPSGGETE